MSTPAAAGHDLRGSQKLLQNLSKNGEAPSIDAIRKAFDLPAAVRIPDWHTRGIPPSYLVMEGRLEVPVAQLGAVVDRFVKLNDSSINFKILINGIPIPDIAQVVVRNIPGEL